MGQNKILSERCIKSYNLGFMSTIHGSRKTKDSDVNLKEVVGQEPHCRRWVAFTLNFFFILQAYIAFLNSESLSVVVVTAEQYCLSFQPGVGIVSIKRPMKLVVFVSFLGVTVYLFCSSKVTSQEHPKGNELSNSFVVRNNVLIAMLACCGCNFPRHISG